MEISRNKKPKHQTPSSSCIPEWFLLEILFKLPFRSVLRFKCLSKQLLTLISEPSFVPEYISRASSKPLPWTLVTRDMLLADQADLQPFGERFERNLWDPSQLESAPTISKLVTPCPSMKKCQVVVISNGLCLCSWGMEKSYSIFNPVTKQFVLLPPRTRVVNDSAMAFYARVDQVGVVSYKLAHLLMDCPRPTTHLTIEEFTSETYKWTSFKAQFPQPISSIYLFNPFSYKGIFHWVDFHEIFGPHRIISYDPVSIIPCPGSGSMHWCGEMVSAGGEHTIRCVREDFEGLIYVWRLKNYERGIWLLEHKFAISKVLFPYVDNKLLTRSELINVALHPSEPDLLYLWGGQGVEKEWMLVSLVIFNVRSRKSRVNDNFTREDDASGRLPVVLKTPFVLPPWPAILPHPSHANDHMDLDLGPVYNLTTQQLNSYNR